MIRYDEALTRIHHALAPLPAVERPPLRLLGCHLAEPLVAETPLPACDDSAMDGFALRAAVTAGASREAPRVLAIVRGLAPLRGTPAIEIAGSSRPLDDAAPEASAVAIPIATGDPLPDGMDAVVPIEWVRIAGDRLEVLRAVEPGANVRRMGEDVQPGDIVAPPGMRIDAGLVMAAASLGLERLRAVRRVRCAVLPVGHHFAAGRPDATGPAVVAAVRAWGAVARLLPPVTGDAAAVAARMAWALRTVDLLITTGAASVGESDVVPAAVDVLGARLLFHGVSIKPGKPIGVAQHEGRTLLLLPGSPAAALAGLEGIGRAVHARLAGDPAGVAPVEAVLGSDLRRRKGKTGLLRGSAVQQGGQLVFTPAARQGPSQISAVVGTNAVAVIPPDVEALPLGAALPILLLERTERRRAMLGHAAGSAVDSSTGGAPTKALASRGRLLAVCGWSGAGKTWVVEQLVVRLTAAGLRIATVKHDGCGEDIEPADKDTALHRAAGAIATALVGAEASVIVRREAASLEDIAADHLARGADLVIAEGFKRAAGVPKIEVAARGRERVHAEPLFALVGEGEPDAVAPDATGMDELARRIERWLTEPS